MEITIEGALKLLSEKPGAKIVGMVTETSPKLLKKGRKTGLPCPVKSVKRLTRRNGMLATSYQNAVNTRRTNEESEDGEFVAQALWNGLGEHVGPLMVRHKTTGKLYVAFRPLTTNNEENKCVVGEDVWRDEEGRVINPKDIAEFLPLSGNSETQKVERQVFWRTISIENIREIVCGEIYTIVGEKQ